MQLMVVKYFILLTCMVSSLRGKALHDKGCYECEEEVWEEVPCNEIPPNATTVATSAAPVLKPTKPPIPKLIKQLTSPPAPNLLTTPPPQATSYSSTISPEFATSEKLQSKCYNDCKIGCKEFCRKVVANPFEKQIVQVSKISEPVQNGNMEITHILQRQLVPKTSHSCANSNNCASFVNNVPESLPVPVQPRVEEKAAVDSHYVQPISPIYGPQAVAQSLDSYPPNPLHLSYHSLPNSIDNYNYPIPFGDVFPKSFLDPVQGLQISLDASGASNQNPIIRSYSSPAQLIENPLETQANLGNFDDPFDSFISHNPSNEQPYETYGKSSYSVSYNIL